MSNKGGHMPNKPVKIIMLTGYLGACPPVFRV